MRTEHGEMRDALAGMRSALDGKHADAYLGLSETLLMLLRQHNLKEERILYPMADQALAASAPEVVRQMAALET
jgi:iron-sulfur cluster repair protein YtfE (RIC family)